MVDAKLYYFSGRVTASYALDEAPTPFKVYADGYLLSVCTPKTRTSAQFYYIPWNIHFHLSPLKNQQVLWSQFENKIITTT